MMNALIKTIILIAFLTNTNVATAQTNAECMDCHSDRELKAVNITGDSIFAFVDTSIYNQAIHHQIEFECVSCHVDIEEIPHKENLALVDCSMCHDDVSETYAQSLHGYALARGNKNAPNCSSCHGTHNIFSSADARSKTYNSQLPQTCGTCHGEHGFKKDPEVRRAKTVEIYLGSVHGKNLAQGVEAAATCSDCHGTHNLKGAADITSNVNKSNIPVTCSKCHAEEYNDYIGSIHGKALMAGISDTPVCTDCHGEHTIKSILDPSSPTFKPSLSEKICADCHENPRIIEKYGLLSGTLKTYKDSYHGLAANRGLERSATCVSCHNSHLILPHTNLNSTIHPDNVAKTCGKCHPNADNNFALSYTHTALSEVSNPIDRVVRSLYLALIYIVVGAMLTHNAIIMSRFIRKKYRNDKSVRTVKRFNAHMILQHFGLLLSFITLVITGFALKFPDAWWVNILAPFGLSEEARSLIHRIAAVVFMITSMYHVIYFLGSKAGRMELKLIAIRMKDLTDIKMNILFHLGKKQTPPQFGKYDYIAKIEYWALIWGSIVMVATGFILWFPETFTRILPSWALKVAETMHYFEAWLATLSIVIWHFFFVIFHPDEYPMSFSMVNGKMPAEEAEIRHSLWVSKKKKPTKNTSGNNRVKKKAEKQNKK